MRKSLFVSICWMIIGFGTALSVKAQRVIGLDGKGIPDVDVLATASCANTGPGSGVETRISKTNAEGGFDWLIFTPTGGGGSNCTLTLSHTFELRKDGFIFSRASFRYSPGPGTPLFPRTTYDDRLSFIHAMPSTTPQWAGVSAANYVAKPLTSDMLAAGFGAAMANETVSSVNLPLATTLGNRRVLVRDVNGTEQPAKLIFVSPTQINFVLPSGLGNGSAVIRVVDQNNAVIRTGLTEINRLALGIFAADANGKGVAASQIVRVKPGNVQSFELVAQYDTATRRFVALPIDFGPADNEIFLVLYGTGFRQVAAQSDVTVTLGGTPGTVTYAGAQPSLDGLDQINVKLPRTLIGRGDVDVVVKVGDLTSNTVTVRIK